MLLLDMSNRKPEAFSPARPSSGPGQASSLRDGYNLVTTCALVRTIQKCPSRECRDEDGNRVSDKERIFRLYQSKQKAAIAVAAS